RMLRGRGRAGLVGRDGRGRARARPGALAATPPLSSYGSALASLILQEDPMSLTSKLSAALAGAGLMYFFDPDRGNPRRAKLANAAVHARRRERELVDKAIRDARHRVRGVAQRAKHRDDRDIPDEVVAGRVHTRLGRTVSHPRAIELSVNDGCVVVRGDI